MKKILLIACLLIGIKAIGQDNYVVGDKSSNQIKKGKLKNGLVYYLIKNKSPKMNYYFLQNTGSSIETEEESGLAHFVEHVTVANSSKHFNKYPLQVFFNRHKIETIAQTYKYKVLYGLKNIDKSKQAVNDSCLLAMHDWLGYTAFKAEEVNKERKIIFEEWRTGNRSPQKIQEFVNKAAYNGSAYAGISNLGSMELIKNCPLDKLKGFYHKWFNTNTVSIAIIGDINFKEYEEKLRKTFGEIQPASNATQFQPILIPDNEKPLFKEFRMRNPRSNSITVFARIKDAEFTNSEMYCKEKFYGELYTRISNLRIKRYQECSQGKFVTGHINYDELPVGYRQLVLNVTPKAGKELDALRDIMACHYDLVQKGLSKREINELKEYFNTTWKTSEEDFDYQKVTEDNFLSGKPLYTVSQYNAVKRKIANAFDNDDFISYCQRRLELKNLMMFAITGAPTNQIIGQGICMKIVNNKTNNQFFQPTLQDVKFDKTLLKPNASISKEEKISGSYLWSYSNGLKVLFRKSDDEYMNVYGFSRGGLSVYERNDIPTGESMVHYPSLLGVKDYNRASIENYKYLNDIKMKISIEEISERISSQTGVGSFEKMLQLLYLNVNYPKFEALNSWEQSALISGIMNSRNQSDEYDVMFETEVYQSNLREAKPWLPDYKAGITPERLKAFYDEKFNNASDWFYVITGNMEVNKVKALVTKYLGALNSNGTQEKIENHKPIILEENFMEISDVGASDVGGTQTNYVYFEPLSTKEIVSLTILEKLIKIRSMQELREKRGGVFNIHLSSKYQSAPEPMSTIGVNFGSDRKNVEPYLEYIDAQFKDIATNRVSEKELKGVKILLSNDQIDLHTLVGSSIGKYLAGEKITEQTLTYYFDSITSADITEFANKIYNNGKVVKFLFK